MSEEGIRSGNDGFGMPATLVTVSGFEGLRLVGSTLKHYTERRIHDGGARSARRTRGYCLDPNGKCPENL